MPIRGRPPQTATLYSTPPYPMTTPSTPPAHSRPSILAALRKAGSRRAPLVASVLSLATVSIVLYVKADNSFYWVGDDNNLWNAPSTGTNGTNWSTLLTGNNDAGTTPGLAVGSLTTDNVSFYFAANNLATSLGQDTQIKSLTFLSTATSAVSIGGANLLTIGTGGITSNSGSAADTLSTNVALGAVQTWTNNSNAALTVSGILSGAGGNDLTLAGAAPGGASTFIFNNANTYSGATTLSTSAAVLTLNGVNGSIQNTSAITLNGGSTLNLDSTDASGGNHTGQDRIKDSTGITANGSTINLLGSASAATTETVGTLTIGSGTTNVTVTPGAGQTATLTFGSIANSINSFSRTAAGGVVNFSNTGTIAAPKVTLDATGMIGGWATIGNLTGPNASSGTNALDFATVTGGNVAAISNYVNNNTEADFVSGNNVKVSAIMDLANATNTINSLYLTGNAVINFGTAPSGTSGSTNKLIITSGAIISNRATGTSGSSNQPTFTQIALIGGGPSLDNTAGPVFQGQITSGGPDLIIDTASNLRLNSVITNNGTTAIGLTKNGTGTLDLGDGNNQLPADVIVNTFTGPVTINGGILVFGDDRNLGAVPTTFTPNAVVLNGGELLTTRAFTSSANRGITVGPQGGTLGYNGGNNWTFASRITGVGGVTFSAVPGGFAQNNVTDSVILSSTPGSSDYQGATILQAQKAAGGTSAFINWNQNDQFRMPPRSH